MEYKIWKKKFKDSNNQVQEKYFACKTTKVTITTEQMIEEIVNRSTFSSGDIKGVISEIYTTLKIHLPIGQNVNVSELGTYGISITSNMIDSPEEIGNLKVIGKRITHRPSSALEKLVKSLHFSYAGEKPVKKEEE